MQAEILDVLKEKNYLFAAEIIQEIKNKNRVVTICRTCGEKDKIRKAGKRNNKQAYLCRSCGHMFLTNSFDESHYEYIKRRLKKMRDYGGIGYIKIGIHGNGYYQTIIENNGLLDIEENGKMRVVKLSIICKKYPRVKERLESGMIRRPCYLYFLNDK